MIGRIPGMREFCKLRWCIVVSCFVMMSISCTTQGSQISGSPDSVRAKSIEIWLGSKQFLLEIADDDISRHVGLMGRTSLSEVDGMVFVYPDEQLRAFWMKDTLIPLSLAFIDADGMVISIHHMAPGSLEPVVSERPASYVIELAAGEFAKAGVIPGDTILALRSGIE